MAMEQSLVTLSNGLRLVFCPMPGVESVSIGVWVGVGGRHESDRQTGISHFIEHLLFKGTRTRSAVSISRAIEGRGGDFNAFTQEDATCYYVRMAARHGEIAFAILADMLGDPRFAEADVTSEREVIRDEILMYRDQPVQVAEDLLGELLWVGHPLGRPLAGRFDSLDRIGRNELFRFKKRGYVPRATVVALAGRIRPESWIRRVERSWSSLGSGPGLASAPIDDQVVQQRVGLAVREVEQTHLALGFRLFGRDDPRRFALKVLSVVLGENMSSRLFQVIRERHGLAYAIQSAVSHFSDTGSFVITAGVEPADLRRTLGLILRELRKMADQPVGCRELRRAQDYLTGQIRLGLESSGRRMNWAGETVMSYGRIVTPEAVIDRLEQVTPEAVQSVARDCLRPARASLAVVGPGLAEPLRGELDERLAVGLG